jgi:gamma-glutamyl phosphate reductase
MELQLENNIVNAISLLFQTLEVEEKTKVLKKLQEELNFYNPEILKSANNKDSFLFNQDEFMKVSNELIEGKKINFEKYKV